MSEPESLAQLLPHADPMILLSGYEPSPSPDTVDAWIDIAPDSPFYVPESGGVPGCVALEYMAQSMALCIGSIRRVRGLGPKLGFVLGSRRLETAIPFFRNGERYRVHVHCTYHDESFGSFDCFIADAAGAVVATAQMTAFQPEGDITPETLEELT